ncbi:MAG: DUF167 family protein [Gammaproteobacteria bacterium]
MNAGDHLGFTRDGGDVLIRCHVQPGARRDELCGLHGDRLKIRIAARAVEGRANERLRSFVSRLFGVPRSKVRLERGLRSRDKLLRVEDAGEIPPALTNLEVK